MGHWYAMGPIGNEGALKLKKRTGCYEASNVWFNPETMEATSFQWWYFVKRIGGKVVFNDYRYSSYTTRHQNKVDRTMQKLGIKVDVTIEAPKGLQNLPAAMSYYEERIKTLISEIQRPRSHKEKNRQRALLINGYRGKIWEIQDLLRAEAKQAA